MSRTTAGSDPHLPPRRARLFALLTRNATDVGQFIRLPNDRVVEIGVPIEL